MGYNCTLKKKRNPFFNLEIRYALQHYSGYIHKHDLKNVIWNGTQPTDGRESIEVLERTTHLAASIATTATTITRELRE